MSFGLNHTWTLSNVSNVGRRLEHFIDSSGQVNYRNRADQQRAQDMFGDSNPTEHILRGNFVWDLPDYRGETIKNTAVHYALRVVRYDVDPERNPFGLALAGFATTPERLVEAEVQP